jgi:hypothetical protein
MFNGRQDLLSQDPLSTRKLRSNRSDSAVWPDVECTLQLLPEFVFEQGSRLLRRGLDPVASALVHRY